MVEVSGYAIYLFLISIILLFSYINSLPADTTESFTPRIKQFYRPHLRRMRAYITNFHEKMHTRISNFLRKRGLV